MARVLGISLITRIERQRNRAKEHRCQQKSARLVFAERWAGKVRKLWFAGGCKRLILVYQDVQRDGVIGVREVLFGQFFSFVQCFDPVKQLRSIFWGSEIRGLVSFESFVLSFFSYRAAFGLSPER